MARDSEVLISESPGRLSRDNGIAALDLPAAQIVYSRDQVAAAGGAVVGVALTGATNAATKFTAGQSLVLGTETDGSADVIIDFFDGHAGAYAGANHGVDVQTNAAVSLTTALAAIQAAWRANGGAGAAAATVGIVGGSLKVSTGNVAKSLNVEGDVALLGALGIADGVYQPTAAAVAGYAPYIDGLTDDQKKTVAVNLNKVKAGDRIVVANWGAEIKGAITVWPADPDVKADAVAALADRGIKVR